MWQWMLVQLKKSVASNLSTSNEEDKLLILNQCTILMFYFHFIYPYAKLHDALAAVFFLICIVYFIFNLFFVTSACEFNQSKFLIGKANWNSFAKTVILKAFGESVDFHLIIAILVKRNILKKKLKCRNTLPDFGVYDLNSIAAMCADVQIIKNERCFHAELSPQKYKPLIHASGIFC
ncbi:hypothetical protein Tsp_05269 [Trichinella spiralis]|uniref:hypothetical protein n=1 Tax=Trichinella spiralis TaxID=6334 RepID=UPI0001EFEC7C|nr:hypothetical protein Tsp_05269 [Trichinella spiralis]